MEARKVIDFVSYLVNRLEPDYTLRLVGVEFSQKHGHEICIMQLSGKNVFPKYTPQEILSNPKGMVGLSPQDAVTISKLDDIIQKRKKQSKVLEVDKNGSIVLKMSSGRTQRFSENYISTYRRDVLQSMRPEDAHDLGYRVGFKEGASIQQQKLKANKLRKHNISKFFPILRLIKK